MQTQTIPIACRADAPLAARTYSTERAAAAELHVKPQTLRAAVCRDGIYAVVISHKLPSRFLAWPAEAIDALVRGEAL